MKLACEEYRLEHTAQGRVLFETEDPNLMLAAVAVHVSCYPEHASQLRILGFDRRGVLRERIRIRPPRRRPRG